MLTCKSSHLVFYKHANATLLGHGDSRIATANMFITLSPMAALVLFISVLVMGPLMVDCWHVISFKYHNLFPEGFDWDAAAGRFVVGSLGHGTLHAISDAGDVEVIVPTHLLPPNVTVGGIAVDPPRHRLLAVIHAVPPFPPFDALAAYDLRSRRRIFLSELPDNKSERAVANDVTVGPKGDAFVTNSAGNFIWKVDVGGSTGVFSDSPVYTDGHAIREELAPDCGLNGIVYVGNGDLLAVQYNTGKLYRVDTTDGTASLVRLQTDLTGADGVAIDGAGAGAVVSRHTAWLLISSDWWSSAAVEKEAVTDVGRFPTTVAVRDGRFYVVYGRIGDWLEGGVDQEEFTIEEIEWKEKKRKTDFFPMLLMTIFCTTLFYLCYCNIITDMLLKIKTKLP